MAQESEGAQRPLTKGLWFTTTHWSVVLAAGQRGSPEADIAMEKLCRTYWYPLYAYVRRQGYSPHDSQDLIQEFFARLLQSNSVGTADRERGKFRSFLLVTLKRFLTNERARKSAVKRGGGAPIISLDEQTAEGLYRLEPASELSPERIFEKRWAATLLETAFTRAREEFSAAGKGSLFERLKVYLADQTERGDYANAAAELKVSPNTVAKTVQRLRERYRELVREEVANSVADANEVEEEMRFLFGVLAR
jgi:RNA polymerase sigma-70 factor (ECF subfamily)